MTDIYPCDGCGKPTHIDQLDGKPQSLALTKVTGQDLGDHQDEDFECLQCKDCYGPAWSHDPRTTPPPRCTPDT